MNHKPYGVRIKWLSVACFEMDFGTTTVVSDPFVTDSPGTELDWTAIEKCDFITLSHTHWDHITDIPRLMQKFDPLLLTGELGARDLCEWVNMNPSRMYPMTPNLELDFDVIRIKALFGRHFDLGATYEKDAIIPDTRKIFLDNPGLNPLRTWGILEYRNFLITAPNGTKLLIWGNNPSVEQRNMVKPLAPDIAILQLSKQDPLEMAEFAAAIGAKIVMPHHMDLKLTEEQYMPRVNAFRDAFLKLKPDATFVCPKHGEWMEF